MYAHFFHAHSSDDVFTFVEALCQLVGRALSWDERGLGIANETIAERAQHPTAEKGDRF